MLLFIEVHADTSPPHGPAIATVIRHVRSIYIPIYRAYNHYRPSGIDPFSAA
jgi:hypothetical protein